MEVPAVLDDASPTRSMGDELIADEGGNENGSRRKQDGGGVWHEVGRTDWMRGNNHPVFEKRIEIPFFPSAEQVLVIRTAAQHIRTCLMHRRSKYAKFDDVVFWVDADLEVSGVGWP